MALALQYHQTSQLPRSQTTGNDLARHQCNRLRRAPATTWGLAATPDSLIKGGPLRSGWSGFNGKFELWVAGTVSPLARQQMALAIRGFTVVENGITCFRTEPDESDDSIFFKILNGGYR